MPNTNLIVQNIEKLIAAEKDHFKRWRYRMILQETLQKLEKLTV